MLINTLLGLCLITKTEKFEEADCRPRPAVVPIDISHKYKPYHILLYRCSGTFNKVSPSVKKCAVREQHDVLVDVLDEDGIKTALHVKNHTKCGAECALSDCGGGMVMDDCTCRCLTGDCDDKEPPSAARRIATDGKKVVWNNHSKSAIERDYLFTKE